MPKLNRWCFAKFYDFLFCNWNNLWIFISGEILFQSFAVFLQKLPFPCFDFASSFYSQIEFSLNTLLDSGQFISLNFWSTSLGDFPQKINDYNGDLKSDLVRILNGPKQLCTRPTIWILDQYIRKQNGVNLSGILIVGLSGIQMAFQNQTIWHPTSFRPFKIQTNSVFRSPLY